jgi:hypothetical protein
VVLKAYLYTSEKSLILSFYPKTPQGGLYPFDFTLWTSVSSPWLSPAEAGQVVTVLIFFFPADLADWRRFKLNISAYKLYLRENIYSLL